MIRLDKYLSLKGICTRAKVTNYLKNNEVIIDGKRVQDKTFKIKDNTTLQINKKAYVYKPYVYFKINKPKNMICSSIDELYPSVLNILNETDYQTDLFCVGRLDVDTTGILLVTNDGKFSHNLLSPNKHVSKVYEVTLKYSISSEDIINLQNGVYINNNYLTKECSVEVISDKKILLTIDEGKYHQIKEMMNAVGNQVVSLHRQKFGEYIIDFDTNYLEFSIS